MAKPYTPKSPSRSQGSLLNPKDVIKNNLPTFWTRLCRLGIPSLLSLFLGGILLTLVAVNALAGPKTEEEGKFTREGRLRFRYGSTWDLRVWIAVTGVGFGLLSHGYAEAQNHLFGWWCSRMARTEAGLDYGRYLNTLSRAPVFYGARGYWPFATLKYTLSVLTIAASIGYKFGLVAGDLETEATVLRDIAVSEIPPPLDDDAQWGLSSDQTTSEPWFTDDFNATEYGFLHRFENEEGLSTGPDEVMFAEPMCLYGRFFMGEPSIHQGLIISREIVLLATKTEISELENLTMSRDDKDWIQAETIDSTWLGDERAVVQYRSPQRGKLQVQWGKMGSWYTEKTSTQSEPVLGRVTYTASYAVAEVGREYTTSTCLTIFDTARRLYLQKAAPSRPQAFGVTSQYGDEAILAVNDSIVAQENSETHSTMVGLRFWINALIAARSIHGLHGISAIVRAFLDVTAAEDKAAGRRTLEILPIHDKPFGQENDSETYRANVYSYMTYPFYSGWQRGGLVGCHLPAAVIFLIVGILSIAAMITRIVVGPPEITSWTAQHIYLSQAGMVSMNDEKANLLSSGYLVAPPGLGRLKIGTNVLSKQRHSTGSDSPVGDEVIGQSEVETD